MIVTYSNADIKDAAVKANVKYDLRLEVTCDKAKTGEIKTWTAQYVNNVIVLSASSSQGCGFGLNDIMDLFQNYKWFTLGVFSFIGIIFLFFGKNAYKWTLLLCGFCLGFLLIAGGAYATSMLVEATPTKKYIILGVAVLVGLIVGFVLYKFEASTVSIVCGLLTVLIVMALINFFLPGFTPNQWVTLGIYLVAGAIGGAIGSYFKE